MPPSQTPKSKNLNAPEPNAYLQSKKFFYTPHLGAIALSTSAQILHTPQNVQQMPTSTQGFIFHHPRRQNHHSYHRRCSLHRQTRRHQHNRPRYPREICPPTTSVQQFQIFYDDRVFS